MLIRTDSVVVRTETEENFCTALIKPNKYSMISCTSLYISPNDNSKYKMHRLMDYLMGLMETYKNITIIIYGDSNRKLGKT